MTSRMLSGLALAALVSCGVTACKPAVSSEKTQANASSASPALEPVASAERAAPASIAKSAAVITIGADGKTTVVRQGNNGWTCMPDNPATPGADPMCMDANAMKWAVAWIAHKSPPADNIGLMYMLAGGSDASNTDPWGDKPANGKWVETGPHVMVVGAESLNRNYPSGANPDTTKPYVMFGGTPYAHLMVPIK